MGWSQSLVTSSDSIKAFLPYNKNTGIDMRQLINTGNREKSGLSPDVILYTLFDNKICQAVFKEGPMHALGDAMSEIVVSGASTLSGYAYLGQFLAHDLSRLREKGHKLSIATLANDRLYSSVTSQLDLSSVYGTSLSASNQFRQEGSALMRLGAAFVNEKAELPGYDLPRKNGKAIIADDRNDDNLIVSQLHLQFLKLHNYFVKNISCDEPGLSTDELFEAAKEQVILHYQEVILYDFLFEIIHPQVWNAIIENDLSIIWKIEPDEPAVLPIEFIGAAARFGHSMVLDQYTLNSDSSADIDELFAMTGEGQFGGKYNQLPMSHIIDWLYFFDFPSIKRMAINSKNKTRKISPRVLIELRNTITLENPQVTNLAVRNLIRGSQLGLSSGQDVVDYVTSNYSKELLESGISIKPLTNEQLNLHKHFPPQTLLGIECPELLTKTPLWYYLMAEACVDVPKDFGRLGPLGSLILAESIKGLLKLDRNSYYYSGKRRQDIKASKEIVQAGGKKKYCLQMSDLILAVNPELPDPSQFSQPKQL